jgi:CRISPR-associated endonuclease/helicase Cas3
MVSPKQFFAHSTSNSDRSDWESLPTHLSEVASLAAAFAEEFDSAEWGRLAGLWHDLGKYHPGFQRRLEDPSVTQPHSGAGAWHAKESAPNTALPLAGVIAGHHTGLANWTDGATLRERLDRAGRGEWPDTKPNVPSILLDHAIPAIPGWVNGNFELEFWTRMLFSALVDADRLCTEAFYDPRSVTRRAGARDSIDLLRDRLELELTRITVGLDDEARSRSVNVHRAEVSDSCQSAAAHSPGFFSLTVPTGGGKTLAAMRFALHHAAQYGLRRVIVVIPYTSIIEQNASHYARIFGRNNVLEHHSNLDIDRRQRDVSEDVADWQDLAAENWDAPIIVTTTVQFFESLFTNHPSRARKLHNIVQSVVVLDEVQSLPPDKLLTILDGLKQLVAHYNCSIVLSTATPPALRKRAQFPRGIEHVREIVSDPSALASRLRRVRYEWPLPESPPVEWTALATEVAAQRSALVVTHRRADARVLAKELEALVDKEVVLHLSALMCPSHRLDVLARVRARLERDEPVILVSTTLIEAGVDVDFPVVYRALGGLDSIVQAGGRCNREGRLAAGRVVVFRAPTAPPPGVPRNGLATTELLLASEEDIDADDPVTQERFFTRLYGTMNTDSASIQRERDQLNFATVAEKFRLIEDGFTHSVIVPYGRAMELMGELKEAIKRGDANLRDRFRALQPYTVSIYEKSFNDVLKVGALVEVCDGLHHLREESKRHYDSKYGLVVGDDIGTMNSEALVM